MDRLTARYGDNRAVPTRVDLTFVFGIDDGTYLGLVDIFDRLADYEDTCLEPEEIAPVMQLAEKMNVVDLVRENLRISNRLRHTKVELNRLKTIDKAQDEGRMVVLDEPRKPLVWGDDDHDTCLCPDCSKDLMSLYDGEHMILQCPECGQYVDATKVLARAEAEAAIGGGQT